MNQRDFEQAAMFLMELAAEAGVVSHFVLLYRLEGTSTTVTMSDAPTTEDIAVALASWLKSYADNGRRAHETRVYEGGEIVNAAELPN